MKKTMLLVLGLMIFSTAVMACSDSDLMSIPNYEPKRDWQQGINTSNPKGYIDTVNYSDLNYPTIRYYDYCKDSEIIIEYYCQPNTQQQESAAEQFEKVHGWREYFWHSASIEQICPYGCDNAQCQP